ncbi:MAG: divalent metal cation transporter [Candidatus Omnitrophota bacterium]|jgi:Mn2+/Fe2+ NRAMP family transporter
MRKDTPERSSQKIIKILPMFSSADPQALEKEKKELAKLDSQPTLKRWSGYFIKTGPGWLQGAVTLGAGTAAACLFLGATYGYSLLWVQPLAMLVAIIMFMASSHQTLSTGMKPFEAVRKYIHPALAWTWAIATLLSTIIWHFPQYALAGGVITDFINIFTGYAPSGMAQIILLLVIGFFVFILAAFIVWNYGKGLRGTRIFERILKILILIIIISFAIVFLRLAAKGNIDWFALLKGFVPSFIPTDPKGATLVMGAFSAAVGINMTFIFGYSQLARGWGKEHRALSRFDLISGMLLPYVIAVSLITAVAALVIYTPNQSIPGIISPVQVAKLVANTGLGLFFGRIIFDLGILSMVLSTIIMHMLICGFVASEIFGVTPGSMRYKLSCLIPMPGVLGVVLWKYMGYWVAVPASAIAGLMLPIAYLGWFILNNNRGFLGADMPTGKKRIVFNIVMLIAIAISLAGIIFYLCAQSNLLRIK